MGSQTPIYSLPFPVPTDAPNGPAQLESLARAVEAKLGAQVPTKAALLALTGMAQGQRGYVLDGRTNTAEGVAVPSEWVYVGTAWRPVPGTVVADLRRTSAQAAAAQPAVISFPDTPDIDLLDGHSTATNPSRYTCTVPGRYKFEGAARANILASGTAYDANWAKNGTVLPNRTAPLAANSSASAGNGYRPGVLTIALAVGDYIEMSCTNALGGNITFQDGQMIATYVGHV